jgi:hypothetical protein
MQHFKDFIDEKGRKAKRELGLIQQVLEKAGLKAVSRYDEQGDEDEPYVYVPANGDLTFGGVRIYKVGNHIAYKIQKEEDTQPYGRAYELAVEDMYNDLVADHMDEEKAGKRVMEAIAAEMKRFFEKSRKAEGDLEELKDDKKKINLRNMMDYGSATTASRL